MKADRDQAAPSPQQRARCIILTAVGEEPERDLQALIHRHRWEALCTDDAYQAMAELCLEERMQASRAAWGLQRARGLALVIVQTTGNGARRDEPLVHAVQKYLPETGIWSYASGALTAIEPPPASDQPLEKDRPASHDAVPSDEDPLCDFEPAEITSQEIEMLLARDGEEEPRSP